MTNTSRVCGPFLALALAVACYGQAGYIQSSPLTGAAAFGAKCDGAHNDGPAINAAITAALTATSSNGGAVIVGPGKCLTNEQILTRTRVSLRGVSQSGTWIVAGPSFPINTPVIKIGHTTLDAAGAVGAMVMDLTVDCSGITGCTTVYSDTAQEGSGVMRVTTMRYDDYGVHFHGNGAMNWTMQDVWAWPQPAATHSEGIFADASSSVNVIARVTVAGGGAAVQPGAAIHIYNSMVHLSSVHCETHKDCVNFDGYGGGTVQAISGLADVTNTVHIGATASPVTVIASSSVGGAVNILDDGLGKTIATWYVSLYATAGNPTLTPNLITTDFGTPTVLQRLGLFGPAAKLAILNNTILGAESLTNGALTAGTSWTRTGDIALAANAATFTFATGAGTLSQAAVNQVFNPGAAAQWYKFTYTVSGVTAVTPACSITNAFADTTFGTALSMTAGVAKILYFKSAAAPGAFTLSCTAASGAFTLDDLSLLEIQGGDLSVGGAINARTGLISGGTGIETLILKAGKSAGQAAVPLLDIVNAAGARVAYIDMTGVLSALQVTTGAGFSAATSGASLNNAAKVYWSSDGTFYGVKDLAISRPAPGVMEINNGVAGTYRDLRLREIQWNNDAEGACDATNRGRVVMVQGGAGVADTYRICAKNVLDIYGWTALY